jgi:hypothetical protein
MNKLQYFCKIADGNIQGNLFQRIQKDVLELEEGWYCMTIDKKNKRSNLQNNYYWGAVIEDCILGVRESWGEKITKETAHELLKSNCNFKQIITQDGEIQKLTMETKKLSKVEFEVYLNDCRNFIKQYFGIDTLLPNEQSEIDYE